MSELLVASDLRARRERLRLSQAALAERVGASRQAIVAIEAGRRVPSTVLSLRLSRALGCRVEDIFTLADADELIAEIAPVPPAALPQAAKYAPLSGRVAVGRVRGRWVAHAIAPTDPAAADGLVTVTSQPDPADTPQSRAIVTPLVPVDQLSRNALVAGCAPLLATLADRVDARFAEARMNWIPATSALALDHLSRGLVHVAGIHFTKVGQGSANYEEVQRTFPHRTMLIVNLTRWVQGLVVPQGNPLKIRTAADLLRPGMRYAGREEGAGATKLIRNLLAGEGAEAAPLHGPLAQGHADVAHMVRFGAADVGVAIEAVALASGLGFIPLAEERFDLVVPGDLAELPAVSRLIDAIDDSSFREEVARLPGYDPTISGHVTRIEAA